MHVHADKSSLSCPVRIIDIERYTFYLLFCVHREQEFSYKEGAFQYTSKPCRLRDSHRPKFDVLLTSYEFVSMDFQTLSSIDWDVVIIDEAHRLKNNQSLVSTRNAYHFDSFSVECTDNLDYIWVRRI